MAEEVLPSTGYNIRNLAQDLEQYAILQKKTKNLSVDELKNSTEYHHMLTIERKLAAFTFSGDRLLELADFMVGESSIYTHHIYEELAQEHKALQEKHNNLIEMLTGAIKPFNGVLDLAKILQEELKELK